MVTINEVSTELSKIIKPIIPNITVDYHHMHNGWTALLYGGPSLEYATIRLLIPLEDIDPPDYFKSVNNILNVVVKTLEKISTKYSYKSYQSGELLPKVSWQGEVAGFDLSGPQMFN